MKNISADHLFLSTPPTVPCVNPSHPLSITPSHILLYRSSSDRARATSCGECPGRTHTALGVCVSRLTLSCSWHVTLRAISNLMYKDLGAFGPYYGACLVSKDPELWGCDLVRQSYRKRCSTAHCWSCGVSTTHSPDTPTAPTWTILTDLLASRVPTHMLRRKEGTVDFLMVALNPADGCAWPSRTRGHATSLRGPTASCSGRMPN